MAKEQKLARQSLSDFAYKNLYLPASNAQRFLQKKIVNNGDTAVWPVTQDFGECKVHIIKTNGRCDCNDRIEKSYQCKHEYYASECLDLSKYDKIWFNEMTYLNDYGEIYSSIFMDQKQTPTIKVVQ